MFSGEARLGRDFEGRSGVNYILPREQVLPKAFDLARQNRGEAAPVPGGAKAGLVFRSPPVLRGRAHPGDALMHAVSFAAPGVADLIKDMFAGGAAQGKSKDRK